MSITAVFSDRLKEAVNASKPAQPLKVIAHRAGYSKSYIKRLMSGRQSNPSIQAVEALATATGVSVAWLLGIVDQQK